MDSITVPIPSDCKIIRERIIGKVKSVLEKLKKTKKSRWDEIYEDFSEVEYFVLYGDWLRSIIGVGIVDEAYRWKDYEKRMLELEKKCDEILK